VLLAEAVSRRVYWMGQDVATCSHLDERARLGRPISYRLGWSYLVRHKHSPQVPRPQHALAAAVEQETCKKAEAAAEGATASPTPAWNGELLTSIVAA
jgi:hypothetical protein